jgi:hypothetical protein
MEPSINHHRLEYLQPILVTVEEYQDDCVDFRITGVAFGSGFWWLAIFDGLRVG